MDEITRCDKLISHYSNGTEKWHITLNGDIYTALRSSCWFINGHIIDAENSKKLDESRNRIRESHARIQAIDESAHFMMMSNQSGRNVW